MPRLSKNTMFEKNCNCILITFLISILLLYLLNHYKSSIFIEEFNNMQDLFEKNNNNVIKDTTIMNNQNNNTIKPYIESSLENKQYRDLSQMTDENIHFFNDVKFNPSCSSIYSDSRGQACLTNEQQKRINKHN